MKQALRKQILDEAIRIGDELIEKAVPHKTGLSWASINSFGKNKYEWIECETIYSGVCGIQLFFIELYKQTRVEKYLNAAIEGEKWVAEYIKEKEDYKYWFLTGRMSVPFTLLKLYEVTQDNQYIEKALSITRSFPLHLEESFQSEFINGLSGDLLVLIHLHAATQEEWLLELIDKCLGKILNNLHLGKKGVYIDRSKDNISGLCGLSHGASGLGFVLMEVGKYFKNEAFYWLSEQTFEYERQFFDKKGQNWLDLRKGFFDEKDQEEANEAYFSGNIDFFATGRQMNAWCHGAAGIGLTRLRAYEILKKEIYKEESLAAVEKTIETNVIDSHLQSFTLCHGGGGNAEVFIEAYRVLGDAALLDYAATVAQKALLSKSENKYYPSGSVHSVEDTSLFLGNAGIGYFYLRVLEPLNVPSILLPRVDKVLHEKSLLHYPNINIKSEALKRITIESLFQRTIALLESKYPGTIGKYFTHNTEEQTAFKASWIGFLQREISLLPPEERSVVEDVFALELSKVKLDENIISNALISYKAILAAEDGSVLGSLPQAEFEQLAFLTNSDIQIVETNWDWSGDDIGNYLNNLNIPNDTYEWALIPSTTGIQEKLLNSFSYIIITAFSSAKTANAATQEIMEMLDSMSPEKESQVKQFIILQILELLAAGILLRAEKHILNGTKKEKIREQTFVN